MAVWRLVREKRLTHALITGGAGFIGSHLAERLLKAGQTVTIFEVNKEFNRRRANRGR